jgi:hypothetical protein
MNMSTVVLTSVKTGVDGRVQPLVEELVDRVQVVGDPAHEVADGLAVEEPQRQRLGVLENLAAEPVHRVLGRDRQQPAAEPYGEEAADRDDQQHQQGAGQGRGVAVGDGAVDDAAHEHGRDDGQEGADEAQDHHGDDPPGRLPHVGEQPPQRLGRGRLGGRREHVVRHARAPPRAATRRWTGTRGLERSSSACAPLATIRPSSSTTITSAVSTALIRWGDQEHRAVAHQPADRVLDARLGGDVEGAGGVVQDEDLRAPDQRPRDREALALAAREVGPAPFHLTAVPIRAILDEPCGFGGPPR